MEWSGVSQSEKKVLTNNGLRKESGVAAGDGRGGGERDRRACMRDALVDSNLPHFRLAGDVQETCRQVKAMDEKEGFPIASAAGMRSNIGRLQATT